MRRTSKALKAMGTCALLAVMVLAVAPSGAVAKQHAPVLPPTAHPFGQSYSAWAADWWQWALEQPTATNPLVDPTGANCASRQQGKVWFLAGTITSDPVERSCTVRVGTALVFPVVNSFYCVDPGQPDPGEAFLREQVAFVRTSATGLTATIDEATVRNVRAYYEESEIFFVDIPADNPLMAPGGTYGPCVDAGYYIAVRSLPPGEHTIHFGGSLPGSLPGQVVDVDVTYTITVVRGHR